MPEDSGRNSRQRRKLQFTYFADELGAIQETRPVGGIGDASFDCVLTPFRKPNKTLDIDTPEKLRKWDAYWDNVVGWWESERMNQRRSKW